MRQGYAGGYLLETDEIGHRVINRNINKYITK